MKFTPTQIVIGIINPLMLVIYFIRKLPLSWLFKLRMHIDGIDRPYYAYGLYQAAMEAKALGVSRISAIEFGVAGGHGLIIMERLAEQVERITGVMIDIYGFDIKIGLPSPTDYRDLPYIWQKGFFKMDISALRRNIKNSTTLVLGDVKKTVPVFVKKEISPIGFIAFDLDFYSSTKDALNIFEMPDKKMLPRIYCYFDDIVGTDEEIMCEYVGELLAIKEFNEHHKDRKLAKIHGMFHKRAIKSTWSDMIYVMHNFYHKQYSTYIYHSQDRQNVL
jgi:hypothetical protein